ncbi:MAG TPA: DUF6514 family protein [Mobilitalea sp.]|nr:DUF6514 family protein [Mobilitalea sp.]
MKKMELLYSSEVKLEDSRTMKLDYRLTENFDRLEDTEPYYGVHITKYLEDLVECDEVCGISYSKDTVVSMIKVLFQNEVTPISMIGIIDDMVTVGDY